MEWVQKIGEVTGQNLMMSLERKMSFISYVYTLNENPNNNAILECINGNVHFKRYYWDVLKAARKLHECGIIHGDIKADNVVWDARKQRIKFIDFGMSHKIKDQRKIIQQYKKTLVNNSKMENSLKIKHPEIGKLLYTMATLDLKRFQECPILAEMYTWEPGGSCLLDLFLLQTLGKPFGDFYRDARCVLTDYIRAWNLNKEEMQKIEENMDKEKILKGIETMYTFKLRIQDQICRDYNSL